MPQHTVGFVYVLSNEAMPGIVKVGMTTKLAEDRAKQLRNAGVPLPFDVVFRSATSWPSKAEKAAHDLLTPFRVSPDREFFKVSPDVAIEAVRDVLLDVAGIDAWASEGPHHVKGGDRIALTLKEGQVFVLLSYPHLLAEAAEVIDIWQAHTDGDLLELMGTPEPGHVAGFSDGDPDGDADPIPYLDRAGTAPNGSINGRDRMVTGERLLWLAPIAGGEACKLSLFEMTDHCQVISRTWHEKTTPEGHPLLLNMPTYDELPPSMIRTTQAALRLRPPRSWAPRTPETSEGWSPVADDPQPPECWLPQLNSRPSRRDDRR